MKYRMRPASIVLVATLLAAGCGGDDDDAAASTTTTQVEATTTTESSTTTTAPDRPELNNTVDDPVAAYLSIVEFRGSLDVMPDPNLAALIYEPGPLLDGLASVSRSLVENGWHWSEISITTEDVFLSTMPDETTALVSTIERPNPNATLLDSSEQPVPDQPQQGQGRRMIITLARGPDNAWRVRQIDLLAEVP